MRAPQDAVRDAAKADFKRCMRVDINLPVSMVSAHSGRLVAVSMKAREDPCKCGRIHVSTGGSM